MNRREFVIGALGVAGCGGLTSCAGQMAGRAPTGPVDVGTPADYSKDGVTARWAASHGFFVVREGKKLFAVSSTCTHKKCAVEPEAGKATEFACECHGSRFSEAGVVLKGPARTSLPHFGVELDATGHIIVDPARRFEQGQWDDPGAFVVI
jgi:cytochrome b6-f complex iron-sulfur subunit